MAQAVYIKSGDQPRAFVFGNPVVPVTSVLAAQSSMPLYKESVYSAFMAWLKGTGAISGTATFYGTNDDNTGRGFTIPGQSAPGCLATASNGSPTLTAVGCNFSQSMVGLEIRAPGVVAGTTVSAVAAGGATLTMSANAGAGAGTNQTMFYDTLWCATALATVAVSGTGAAADGFTTQAPWRYVQVRWSALTGTITSSGVNMGV